MKCIVIIPASGIGERFDSKIPKQFYKRNGEAIILQTLKKFQSLKEISGIIIATQKKYFKKIDNILNKNKFSKSYKLVKGGKERQDSVYNALKVCNCKENDIILVHDAVRPDVSANLVKELIKNAIKYKAVIPVINISDTIKKIRNKYIEYTVPRENLKRAQTPQAFEYSLLKNAFENAYKNKIKATDESALLEFYGFPVKIIEGEDTNIKITKKSDIK